MKEAGLKMGNISTLGMWGIIYLMHDYAIFRITQIFPNSPALKIYEVGVDYRKLQGYKSYKDTW